MSGAASGPTGCLNFQVSAWAISTIFWPTTLGGTGAASSVAVNCVAIRAACGYAESLTVVILRAMAVSMIPGSTRTTRTPNSFISQAKPSLRASSAHFEAQYGVAGG